jgi:VIT1/CCC1 family predicted Fe2+/Mn2+ transporter
MKSDRWVRTPRPKSKLRRISFGATAAIVTSVGLIAGLNAADAAPSTVVGSLLIVALADNLTDSLGVHVYQESERLAQRDALRTTLANFATRLLVSLSFVACALLAPPRISIYVSAVWGLGLLSGLSYLLARARGVSPTKEIFKHCAVAIAVIVLSTLVGIGVPTWIGAA